jgi:hypothetical protein
MQHCFSKSANDTNREVAKPPLFFIPVSVQLFFIEENNLFFATIFAATENLPDAIIRGVG